jgi:hypothetical protein
MDGQMDEVALERLEGQIEVEEKAIADLRRRTRTLEVEVAAWPGPRRIKGPQQVAADRSRVLEEAFLGIMAGWLLTAVVWVMGAFRVKGYL